jgi:flagella synthesis protein FlgN
MTHFAASQGVVALRRLVDEERARLGELESLLASEHEILATQSSVEALESACAARQDCMGRLLRIQDERRALLAAAGHGADAAAIATFLDRHDPSGAVRAAWGECAELAQRCRDLNDRNGALVGARMRRVEGMLGVLTGQSRETQVYGRHGYRASLPSGQLLAAQA